MAVQSVVGSNREPLICGLRLRLYIKEYTPKEERVFGGVVLFKGLL